MRRPRAATPGAVAGRARAAALRQRRLPGPAPRRLAGAPRSTADEQQRAKAELDLPFESDVDAGPKAAPAAPPPPLRPGERRKGKGGLQAARPPRRVRGRQQRRATLVPTLPPRRPAAAARPAPAAALAAGTELAGKYTVESQLGAGANAITYRARVNATGEHVSGGRHRRKLGGRWRARRQAAGPATALNRQCSAGRRPSSRAWASGN
jgi:hypothetical protein